MATNQKPKSKRRGCRGKASHVRKWIRQGRYERALNRCRGLAFQDEVFSGLSRLAVDLESRRPLLWNDKLDALPLHKEEEPKCVDQLKQRYLPWVDMDPKDPVFELLRYVTTDCRAYFEGAVDVRMARAALDGDIATLRSCRRDVTWPTPRNVDVCTCVFLSFALRTVSDHPPDTLPAFIDNSVSRSLVGSHTQYSAALQRLEHLCVGERGRGKGKRVKGESEWRTETPSQQRHLKRKRSTPLVDVWDMGGCKRRLTPGSPLFAVHDIFAETRGIVLYNLRHAPLMHAR